ncbi:MAG: hypothetical protein JOZ69_21590, partial [Myxococcales bacterium]|nr:hypothetical protein [Myxococcales bacterium]
MLVLRGKESAMRVRRRVSAWAAGVLLVGTGCTAILGDFTTGDLGGGRDGGGRGADANGADRRPGADGPDGIDASSDAGAGNDAKIADATFGDATLGDARSGEAGPADAPSGDATADGTGVAGDATADAACTPGLTRCAGGCVALDAATTCGSCTNDCTALVAAGHVVAASVACTGGRCAYNCVPGYGDCADSGAGCATNFADASDHCGSCARTCNGGACTAATCGAYVVAAQPTTGTVAKLATDGTRVVWSDTGIVAIRQIPAAGGTAISLAPASTSAGGVSSDLALAGRTVAFSYVGVSAPSVGLATVDVADSGVSVIPGAVAVSGVSLNATATHLFFVNVTGTQGSLNDCAISGTTAGTCTGVVGGGRFFNQTAADGAMLFFDLTGANTMQAGLYLDTIATNMSNIFTTDTAQSLALDGTWAYWTILNDGGATYSIRRTLESAPGTSVQTVAADLSSAAFATDGANAYYWNGSSVVSKPVAGGTGTRLS